jgi:hypothetical protein
MVENGIYSVWFKTPQAEGTGNVVLLNGQITGADTVMAYSGSYEQIGDRFIAVVRARRYCDGQPSVLGIDEFELHLVGISTNTIVVCSGTTEQAPGLTFEATLIRAQDQSLRSQRADPPSTVPLRSHEVPESSWRRPLV